MTVISLCHYNTITCDLLPDIEFTINANSESPGSASQAPVSCVFHGVDSDGNLLTPAECPLTQTLQAFDEAQNAWVDYSVDQLSPVDQAGSPTATCTYGNPTCVYQYDFDNQDGAYNDLVGPLSMRWVITDPLSQQPDGTVSVEFIR